ncbi:DUF6250 domain-containing protein [Bacteroides sp.]|uniref:DUF6250 domain-containing protein n=1 Tax=Bacteroides sp. TaxID=29523 RepID=UPI0025C1691A|nr:DUF6250 domain-containing protein [Bacteroides sp.]
MNPIKLLLRARISYIIFLGIIFSLVPTFNVIAQCSLSDWTPEDSSGKLNITCRGDTMEISSPGGLSLWYNQRLTGNYEISYSIRFLMEGGTYDRLSDLNCFWGANDPLHPNDFFARSDWRQGVFTNYNSLNLFYVGYGGNHNKTTRFRRYHSEYYGVNEDKVRPVIKEYTDSEHLLKEKTWYNIRILVESNSTSYYINGEKLFQYSIGEKEADGYFALRLLKSHTLFTGFKIKQTN